MSNVDNKWSWLLCGACLFNLLFVQGTVRSVGVFYVSTVEQWHIHRVEAAWPFNLCAAFEGFGLFLTGISSQKNVVCRGAIVAALLFSSVFALSSITKNIYILIVLIGIIGGLCHGYIVAASFICICHSFKRYRNIAMGITVCGSSVGGIILPYFHNFLLETYPLNHVYLLASGACLQTLISVMLCRLVMIKKSKKRSLKEQRQEMETHRHLTIEMKETAVTSPIIPKDNYILREKESLFQIIKIYFKKKLMLLLHPVLYIYVISFAILMFCVWFWYIVIVDYAMDKGHSRNVATSLISVLSTSGIIGRFSFGWTLDFGWIKRRTGLIVLFFAMGLSTFLAPFFINIFVLIALSIVFSSSTGAIVTLRASVPAAYFGIKEMPFALGLNGILSSSASLLRPWLIGYFRDGKGSYDIIFYTLGVLPCFASILWLMEPLAMKIQSRKQEDREWEE